MRVWGIIIHQLLTNKNTVHKDPSYWISGLCITSSTPRPHFHRVTWDHLSNIETLGGVASSLLLLLLNICEPKSVVKEALQLNIQSSQAWGCYYIYEQWQWQEGSAATHFEIVLPPCLLLVTNSNGWTFTWNCCISLHNINMPFLKISTMSKLLPSSTHETHRQVTSTLRRDAPARNFTPSTFWSLTRINHLRLVIASSNPSSYAKIIHRVILKMKRQANLCSHFSLDMMGASLSLEIHLPIVPTHLGNCRLGQPACATEMCMKYNSSVWSINGDVWNRDCNLDYICMPTDPIL